MASITERPRKGGSSFLLRWRYQGGQDCMTLDTREKAELWKALLEANNHSLTAAERAIQNAHAGMTSVWSCGPEGHPSRRHGTG